MLPIPDPAAPDWAAVRKAPSAAHWMGTDEIGRDVLSRLIWGAQASLLAGVVSVGIALALGVPLGILAGYFGGWTDAVISRCTEALLAAPFLILAIALAAFLGPSLTNARNAVAMVRVACTRSGGSTLGREERARILGGGRTMTRGNST